MPSEARTVSLYAGHVIAENTNSRLIRQSPAFPVIIMFTCIKLPISALRAPSPVRLMSSSAAASSFITDKAFIDGKWVASSRSPFEVRNPENNQVIGHAANCCEKEVDLAIHAAKRAFETWSTTPAKVRSALLRRMFQLQMEHQSELADLIARSVTLSFRVCLFVCFACHVASACSDSV